MEGVVRKLMIRCVICVILFLFFLNHQKGTSIQEIVDRNTNQPQLIMLVEEDLQTQFFVAVEQIPQIEVTDLLKGLFVLFALHYIFDLEYNPRLKDFYSFVEDKLLRLPSQSCKKSPNYSSVTSAIECFFDK